ncbi:MAG TPA: hypothetical protein VFN55_01050 [Solirubrobacteraceae bacterium]|nr:hypothetical protein [Solirubrobacteraceae bacterium]
MTSRLGLLLVVLCLAGTALSGCGASLASSSAGPGAAQGTVHFAKTKFLLHAGLAFGAFHRYVYKPFRAGVFSHPFLHKLSLVKAGLAALFIRHELRLAAADVRASPTLRKLFSPLTAVANKIGSLRHDITSGSVGAGALNGVQSQLSSVGSAAAGHGQAIRDLVPSSGQLAGG